MNVDIALGLWGDNGGKYLSWEFEAYLRSKGIRYELIIAHTPEQNGVAEEMNRTLLESARAMIAQADLPTNYWAEAVATAGDDISSQREQDTAWEVVWEKTRY